VFILILLNFRIEFYCNIFELGIYSVVAGNSFQSENRDGAGMNAKFSYPYGIDQQTETLSISNQNNHNISKITL
jgi:hypothetical protein